MTDLTTPRVEVIADYPNSPFKVGDILTLVEHKDNSGLVYSANHTYPPSTFVVHPHDVDKCPAIFHKMQWWEKRELSDIPRYVLVHQGLPNCKRGGKAFRVESIDMGYFRIDGGYAYEFGDVTPLTKEEYEKPKTKWND